jgi:hypothetical protein
LTFIDRAVVGDAVFSRGDYFGDLLGGEFSPHGPLRSMHRSRRLGLLSFVPLAALVALIAVMAQITAAVASSAGESSPAALLIGFGVVVAGPLGPPIYWFACVRTSS